MSKQIKAMVTGSDGAVAAPAVASTSKPAKGQKPSRKTAHNQGDAGVPSGDAVPIISKYQSDGFAAKQVPDDPVWTALLHDLGTMSTMALRAKYAGEANTHRNMLQRVKTCGAVVHPDFLRFTDFLRLVGPKPTSRATLDRIDNHDPEYAPGKVRWADKTTQNRNKGDSLIFTCPNTGRSYTASQLGVKQGVSATAIRKRRREGWTDGEIITGERASTVAVTAAEAKPAPIRPYAPPLTLAQRLFKENREYCEFFRHTVGREPFIHTPVEYQAIFQDDRPDVRGDEWLRSCEKAFLNHHLPRWWKKYGPHIRFHALRPDQQAWVLRIDPSQGQKLELSDAVSVR
jgi:hypothetical protein